MHEAVGVADVLMRLGELRAAGFLDESEYSRVKSILIGRIVEMCLHSRGCET